MQSHDPLLAEQMAAAHEAECESATMALLKERRRERKSRWCKNWAPNGQPHMGTCETCGVPWQSFAVDDNFRCPHWTEIN